MITGERVQNPETSRITPADSEFNEIESYETSERAFWMREFLYEIEFGTASQSEHWEKLGMESNQWNPAVIEKYKLPFFNGDKYSFEEFFENTTNKYLHQTGTRTIAKVSQGEVVMADPEVNPYLLLSMSECSALVGKTEAGKLVIAHLSMSERLQLEKAMEFYALQGIKPENIAAVVSKVEEPRAQIEDYQKLGIANIHPFEFISGGFRTLEDKSTSILSLGNITQIVISKDLAFKYSMDCEQIHKSKFGFTDVTYRRVSDYRNEEILAI